MRQCEAQTALEAQEECKKTHKTQPGQPVAFFLIANFYIPQKAHHRFEIRYYLLQ